MSPLIVWHTMRQTASATHRDPDSSPGLDAILKAISRPDIGPGVVHRDNISKSFVEIMAGYGEALDVGADRIEDLKRLKALCESAPDDEHLLVLAVVLFDRLIDGYWNEIEAECEVLMEQSSALRSAGLAPFLAHPTTLTSDWTHH